MFCGLSGFPQGHLFMSRAHTWVGQVALAPSSFAKWDDAHQIVLVCLGFPRNLIFCVGHASSIWPGCLGVETTVLEGYE